MEALPRASLSGPEAGHSNRGRAHGLSSCGGKCSSRVKGNVVETLKIYCAVSSRGLRKEPSFKSLRSLV